MYLIYALNFILKIKCSNLTNFIENDIKIFASNANHIFLGLNDIRSTLVSKSKYNNLTNFISDAWITPSQTYFKIRFGDNPICSSNSHVIKCSLSSDWQFDKKPLGYTIGDGTKCITLNDNEIIEMTNCTGSNDQLFDFRMSSDEKPCNKNEKEKNDRDIIVINLSGSNNCGSLINNQCLQSLDTIKNCGCNKDIISNISKDIETKISYEPKPILHHEIYDDQIHEPKPILHHEIYDDQIHEPKPILHHEIYDDQIYEPSLITESLPKEIIDKPFIPRKEPNFLRIINYKTKKPETKKIKVTKIFKTIPEIVDKNSMINDLTNPIDDKYLTYYKPKVSVTDKIVNDDVFNDITNEFSDIENSSEKYKKYERDEKDKKKNRSGHLKKIKTFFW